MLIIMYLNQLTNQPID